MSEFNPLHVSAYADADELLGQMYRRLAAGLSAATTIQMILGCSDEDAQEVQMWVACDPHDSTGSLDRETKRLRQFEQALYDRMRMDGFAW